MILHDDPGVEKTRQPFESPGPYDVMQMPDGMWIFNYADQTVTRLTIPGNHIHHVSVPGLKRGQNLDAVDDMTNDGPIWIGGVLMEKLK